MAMMEVLLKEDVDNLGVRGDLVKVRPGYGRNYLLPRGLAVLATAANVHLAATCPNFVILEYIPDDVAPRRDLIQEPVRLVDGYLELPTAPGLGIELNESAFGRYPYRPWRRGFPWRPDGSLAYQ